jgi:hypothetical protein
MPVENNIVTNMPAPYSRAKVELNPCNTHFDLRWWILSRVFAVSSRVIDTSRIGILSSSRL